MRPTKDSWKSAMTKIKPTSFYSNDHEKIKINWFAYEYAMAVYDDVGTSFRRRLISNGITSEEFAKFSIYISKFMIENAKKMLSGEIEKVCFSYEMIEAYFPAMRDRDINRLLELTAKSWYDLLGFCEMCPNRCLSEKDEPCLMFDEEDLFR
jgi:hypothetical protein